MKIELVLMIIFIIVFLDKALTIANIIQIQNNFPEAKVSQNYNVEKNPIARWFFLKFGLWVGTLIYFVITIVLLYVVFYLFSMWLNPLWALYIIMMIYALVIMNNTYFLIKHSGGFL